MTQSDLSRVPTDHLKAQRDRERLKFAKTDWLIEECHRLSSEALIELGLLRKMIRRDLERINDELDVRDRMIPSLAVAPEQRV